MELLSKKPLFYGACRLCRQGARQRMCSFGKFRIDGRYVQDREQSSVDAEHGRTRTTQVYVPRSEMLIFVDRDRSLFDNAGANAVCALHVLGPYAAEPKSPVLELTLLRILNAMLVGDTSAVAEESGISRLSNHLV